MDYQEIQAKKIWYNLMTANTEEKAWMGKVAAFGCVACQIRFGVHEPTTVHHITDCGRRMGHMFTIPLCPWHHQGYCKSGMSSKAMTDRFGPSLAKSRRDFERIFGTELDLLEHVKSCLGLQPKSA